MELITDYSHFIGTPLLFANELRLRIDIRLRQTDQNDILWVGRYYFYFQNFKILMAYLTSN